MVTRKTAFSPRRAAAGQDAGEAGRWLYGRHTVEAALANPRRRCRRLWLTEEAAAALTAELKARAAEVRIGTRAELDRVLPHGVVHQGIALRADPLDSGHFEDFLTALPADTAATVVVLDQVTDPQNVGAVLRSAAAFGACALIMAQRHAPPIGGALAKAASGGLESVALFALPNLARALEALADYGFWRVGLEAGAAMTLSQALAGKRTVLVLGAEGSGMRRLTRENCDALASIALPGAIASLNVSVAAAIALYEATAEREFPK